MKKFIFFLFISQILWLSANTQTGSVGIGTTSPNASAALDVQSTEKGMLIPRMTTAQRNLIATPAIGLLVFDNTTGSFWFYNGTAWTELVGNGSAGNWTNTGNHIYNNNPGNVGIGNNSPIYHLDIKKPNASIGFTDEDDNHFSGFIKADSTNLHINAYLNPVNQSTIPGNLILQEGLPGYGGNVGIGKPDPDYRLSVLGDIGLSTRYGTYGVLNNIPASGDPAGNFLINARLGNLLSIDPPASLILQYENSQYATSGKVGIGTNSPEQKLDVSGNIQVSGELLRPSTGNANLLPFCYGKVDSLGNIISGTGNFTISKTSTGVYKINIAGLTTTSPAIIVTGFDSYVTDGCFQAGFFSGELYVTYTTYDYYILLPFPPYDEPVFMGTKPSNMGFSFIVYVN